MKKPKCREWIVRVRCEVDKDVICSDCTEGEARQDPFNFATSEEEVQQIKWAVLDVRRND